MEQPTIAAISRYGQLIAKGKQLHALMAQKQSSQQSVGQLQQGLINQEQKYSLLEKRLYICC